MSATHHPLLQRVHEALVDSGLEITAFGRADLPWSRQLVIRVISPEFTDQDDITRQVRVWSALRAAISDEDLTSLAYVFTVSPNETEAQGQIA